MNVALWLRFAARDLRSGLQGFWIFLTCLTLGTAAIAIIGSLSASIERGLDEQGQPLLGGDVGVFPYPPRSNPSRTELYCNATALSAKWRHCAPWP